MYEFAELALLLRHFGNLHVGQSARGFLAVARDEGDGSARVEQFDGVLNLSLLDVERAGYDGIYFLHSMVGNECLISLQI